MVSDGGCGVVWGEGRGEGRVGLGWVQAGSSRTCLAACCAAATSCVTRSSLAGTSCCVSRSRPAVKARQASTANWNPGPSVGHVPSDSTFILYFFCILPLP